LGLKKVERLTSSVQTVLCKNDVCNQFVFLETTHELLYSYTVLRFAQVPKGDVRIFRHTSPITLVELPCMGNFPAWMQLSSFLFLLHRINSIDLVRINNYFPFLFCDRSWWPCLLLQLPQTYVGGTLDDCRR
jgi:hypothetical protein